MAVDGADSANMRLRKPKGMFVCSFHSSAQHPAVCQHQKGGVVSQFSMVIITLLELAQHELQAE